MPLGEGSASSVSGANYEDIACFYMFSLKTEPLDTVLNTAFSPFALYAKLRPNFRDFSWTTFLNPKFPVELTK